MYWPTTTARRLHLSPAGLHPAAHPTHAAASESPTASTSLQAILHVARSFEGDIWASLTADTLTIWSTRPAQVLAALVRTPRSVEEYGANVRLRWKPDGLSLCVETDQSYLLLYALHYLPPRHTSVYAYAPSNGSGARSRSTKELLAPSMTSLRNTFAAGPGEGVALGEGRHPSIEIRFKLVLRIDAGLGTSVSIDDYLIVSTRSPPALQCIPWPQERPTATEGEEAPRPQTRTSLLSRLTWIVPDRQEEHGEEGEGDTEKAEEAAPAYIDNLTYSHEMDMFVLTTTAGHAYCATVEMDSRTAIWRGRCFHGAPIARKRTHSDPQQASTLQKIHQQAATCADVNARFSLLAVGLTDGTVAVYTFRAPDKAVLLSHTFSVRDALRSTASYLKTGACTSLSWTSDGHALAVGWQRGWSVWSTFGKLMGCSLTENWQDASARFSDTFMRGVRHLFWGLGDTELFLSCGQPAVTGIEVDDLDVDHQIFALPFAKSAVAGQHAPDNTRYAFVQLDDSLLVYRGSDQPDVSIINPESDVWNHIKIPQEYLAANWPVRYACISNDGRLIAVAGRRGLTHFSTLSGRWKQFQNAAHEQAFVVRGGLQWYQHVLVAACHIPETGQHQIRLYSRDLNLDEASILYTEHLPSAVVITSLFDNSLLVYTADNTLHHFLIAITETGIHLTLCGSITFEGVVGEPARVRGMSWLVPAQQQQFGDPMDDLMMATIIFLIDGKLVLLRPRRANNGEDEEEVSYDMQILGDRIEYYWTHLQGVGTLENSLWGYDGRRIKLWLDALTIEQAEVRDDYDVPSSDEDRPEYRTIDESMSIPLDFYPLCVLIEKGVVIGVEPEVSLRRSLPFAIFRSTTNTHLFVQHVLRSYLERDQMREAILFASFYRPLVYFAHALEILLHDVLEEEADDDDLQRRLTTSNSTGSMVEYQVTSPEEPGETTTASNSNGKPLLPVVVAFLDHFDECLEVVVNCARKSEVARWGYLFSIVGEPRQLFEVCLQRGHYRTAGSYLMVLHNLDSLNESRSDTVRLLNLARRHGWHTLCQDLLRFTRSLDEDGEALRLLLDEAQLLQDDAITGQLDIPNKGTSPVKPSMSRTPSASTSIHPTIVEEEDEGEEIAAEHAAMPLSIPALNGMESHGSPPRASVGLNGRIVPAMRPTDILRTASHGKEPHFLASDDLLSIGQASTRTVSSPPSRLPV